MGSWLKTKAKEVSDRIWNSEVPLQSDDVPLLDDEIERAIRETVEEAARRCAGQMPDNGAGDARLAAAHAAILRMLTHEVPRG